MDALLYVSKKRSLLMGVAMLLVLIYHFFSWTYNPMGRFNLGYIGVDLFLFLSGFGLEYSFNKNSLLQFYINRFKRVYPIYFIAVLGGYFIFKQYNFSDLLLNLTTLGYYVNNGVNRFDWYVESLFTLYVLFPLFHYYSRTKYLGLIFAFLLAAFITAYLNLNWWHNCLIGRIPIFIYGILFSRYYKSYKYVMYIGVVLFFPIWHYINSSLGVSLLTMALLTVVIKYDYLIEKYNFIQKSLDFLGKNSLEIYIANVFVHRTLEIANTNVTGSIFLYIVLQFVYSWILIKINNIICKYI